MLIDVDMLYPHYNISKVNSDEILNHFEPSSSSIHSAVNDRMTSIQYNHARESSYNCPRRIANSIITTILQGPTYFSADAASASGTFVTSPLETYEF